MDLSSNFFRVSFSSMDTTRSHEGPAIESAATGSVGVLDAEGGDVAAAGGLCPRFHRAVELIGKRWTGAILRVLQGGRTRFNAIAAAIPEMSDRMLAERLRELEHEGIVARLVIPDSPVRVEYELTEKGRALDETFCAIARWAEQWVETEGTAESGDVSQMRQASAPST